MSKLVDQATYERWLHRKALAHVKRDRGRGNDSATNEKYKLAIHQAVCESNGKDAYTNEDLDWSLLSQYDNEQSKKHGRHYKKHFPSFLRLIMLVTERGRQISESARGEQMTQKMIWVLMSLLSYVAKYWRTTANKALVCNDCFVEPPS